MATLYLIEQGTKLAKESRRFLVQKEDRVLLEVPEFKVERVFVFGNVQITTQAMKFLLESGIETAFFSVWGKLVGKLVPVESKNVYLRVAQYEKHKDHDFRVRAAKAIVRGKIRNMKILIQKHGRNHPEIDFSDAFRDLDLCLTELERKTEVPPLVGIEGRATAVYFSSFAKMFRKELGFSGRVRRPPTDPVNSLLSLGYSLITSEMLSVLCGIGFDPYIGFLHSLEYGRPSLALDLIEEFRQPLVDRLTLELTNKGILKEEDFQTKEDGGVYLKDESRRRYFTEYERRMQTETQDPETLERLSYRKGFFTQAQKMAKMLREGTEYTPFTLK